MMGMVIRMTAMVGVLLMVMHFVMGMTMHRMAMIGVKYVWHFPAPLA